MKLNWHSYKYYPYEYDFAKREVKSLLNIIDIEEHENGLSINKRSNSNLERLVYTSSYGVTQKKTIQALLEQGSDSNRSSTRQSTRYSAHGLHEYKGKFNPQVPKAILNILNIKTNSRVLDPFCGSGTSLVETAHLGMEATGTDVNPMAVFLANSKLASLRIDPDALVASAESVIKAKLIKKINQSKRELYLASWFNKEILFEIETLRACISKLDVNISKILLVIVSNLLRDYSLQDPMDLRIRRRTSPLPTKPLRTAFIEKTILFSLRIRHAQKIIQNMGSGKAILLDSQQLLNSKHFKNYFDCAITSPPYAMALPYIDTQRLSLVWLGLSDANNLGLLESQLVGSREFRGIERKTIENSLLQNSENLPKKEHQLCLDLLYALIETDGFRRKAVPTLLYRYFSGMASSFKGVRSVVKKNAPYALVVGGNHTVLGGNRFDINTPTHLSSLAEKNGWKLNEIIPLQTYQRFGYHANNAVANESLIILEAI